MTNQRQLAKSGKEQITSQRTHHAAHGPSSTRQVYAFPRQQTDCTHQCSCWQPCPSVKQTTAIKHKQQIHAFDPERWWRFSAAMIGRQRLRPWASMNRTGSVRWLTDSSSHTDQLPADSPSASAVTFQRCWVRSRRVVSILQTL